MSTRCQIEFRNDDVRRTVYRHWDGYPGAVIRDLLAFLAWSERRGDVEYETANFLYWSKRELGASEQLGFGVCANDELHGDIGPTDQVQSMTAGSLRLKPGMSPHPPHQHPEEEFMVITEGSGEITVAGKKTSVAPGLIMGGEPRSP